MDEPSFCLKLINFSVAAVSHFVHGCPTVTEEEATRRINICRGSTGMGPDKCEHFMGDHCTQCGCYCGGQGKRRFLNKIWWADQHCPIKKW